MIRLMFLKESMLIKPMIEWVHYLSLMVFSKINFYVLAESMRWLSRFNVNGCEF